MTKKYVDTSLSTGNNDGSSPANAWQSFSNVWANTLGTGSVAAGDTIYVRTHDGTSNITESISADQTCALPAGVEIVFDDGTEWANGGVFTWSMGATYRTVYFKAGVSVFADGENYRFRLHCTQSGTRATAWGITGAYYYCRVDGLHIDFQSANLYNCGALPGLMSNLKIECAQAYPGAGYTILYGPQWVDATIENIEIICHATLGTGAGNQGVLFYGPSYGHFRVIGGNVSGANVTWNSNMYMCRHNPHGVMLVENVRVPSDIRPQYIATGSDSDNKAGSTILRGCRSDFDYYEPQFTYGAYIEFEPGKNYPTQSATLPDASNTAWSFKVAPNADVGDDAGVVMRLPLMQKQYDQTAASKTITVEFLVNDLLHSGTFGYSSLSGGTFSAGDTITGATSGATATVVTDNGSNSMTIKSVNGIFSGGESFSNGTGVSATASANFIGVHTGVLPVCVTYVDNSTGDVKTLTNNSWGEPLTTSSATWTNTSYGAKSYDKYKVALSTGSDSIKEDSIISVAVHCAIQQQGTDDFFFVCPDFQVS